MELSVEDKIQLIKEHLGNSAETVMDVLGSGLSLSIYTNAFLHELNRREINYDLGKKVTIMYEGVRVGEEEIQILVAKNIMVEVRSYKTNSTVQDTVAKLKTMVKRTRYKHYVVLNYEPASEKSSGNVRVVMNQD